jgi:hypothetical protein
MPGVSNSVDRFNGVITSLAIKVPCVVVSTVNLTLSGEQTVNGVVVTTGDRVLVNAQTAGAENGIYDVTSTAWNRSADWDGNRDATLRTIVVVGTTVLGENLIFQCDTPGDIVIGNTVVDFSEMDIGGVTFPLDLLDNEQIRFGTGQDLLMYFDGNDMIFDLANAIGTPYAIRLINGDPNDPALFLENAAEIELENTGADGSLTIGHSATDTASIRGGGIMDQLQFQNFDNVRIFGPAGGGGADGAFLYMEERDTALNPLPTPIAGFGLYWILDDVPAAPAFTDDAGVTSILNAPAIGVIDFIVNADINTATPPTTEVVTARVLYKDLADDDELGYVGFDNGHDMEILNQMRGGEFSLKCTDATGLVRTFLEYNPGSVALIRADSNMSLYVNNTQEWVNALVSSSVTLNHSASPALRTATTANGAAEADNDYNGAAGFERVLTESDSMQGLNILLYSFSTGVGGGDPGFGGCAFNNATPASITQVNFDDTARGLINAEWLFAEIEAGDVFTFRSETTPSDIIILQATDAATDQVGYWTVPVRYISGVVPANGSDLRISWHHNAEPLLKGYSIAQADYVPSGTSQALVYADGPAFTVDLESASGNMTLSITGGPSAGNYGQATVRVQQDGATPRTVTWGGGDTYRHVNDTAHPMNTTLDGISVWTLETFDAGASWEVSGADYGP